VLYGKYLREGEAADPFTTRRAGLEAARVAEGLGQWLAAGNVYRELQTLFPSMRARLEKDLARAREHGE
jgi:hypothetical protein